MTVKPTVKTHPPDKTVLILLALACLGLLMIFFGSRKNEPLPQTDAAETYLDITERKLCETVARIRGAGTVTVFVTPERTLPAAAHDSLPASASGGTASGTAVQTYPKIGGVLVVCSGGDDEAVAAEIRNAVSVALGISKHKIYVTRGVQ